MACLISTARTLQCKTGLGGLLNLYFLNKGEFVVTVDAVSGITHISGATNGVVVDGKAAELYEVQIKGVSNFSQEMISSAENGTTSVVQTLTVDLQHSDFQTNNFIKLLAYGYPSVVAVTNDGKAWLLGMLRGMDVTSATFVSGSAISDKNGYTLTLIGNENEYSPEIYGSNTTSAFGGLDATSAININQG